MMKAMYIILFVVCRFFIMGAMAYQMIFVYECSDYFKIGTVLLLILAMVLLVPLTVDTAKIYRRYKEIKMTKHTKQN